MPRSPRIEYEGALYHVLCRGDRREPIFRDDRDRRNFLETLGEVCERSGAFVCSFVLILEKTTGGDPEEARCGGSPAGSQCGAEKPWDGPGRGTGLGEGRAAQTGIELAGENPHGDSRCMDMRSTGHGGPKQYQPGCLGISAGKNQGNQKMETCFARMHGLTPAFDLLFVESIGYPIRVSS